MKGFRELFNQIRLIWLSLTSKIKSLFSSNKHKSLNTSNEQGNTEKGYNGDTKGNGIDSEDEQDVWYDALEELEEYFDAVENLNEQEVSIDSKRREYEKNKYYSLQDGLQEKIEFNRSTATLALAFEIGKPLPDSDLSKFKLCELKQNGDKYTFTLEDNGKNRVELHSEYLNIYFPKYFEKHREKGMYTELFSEKENRISNDIIIPLQVPKEVSILTKKFGWMNPRKIIQSKIPDFPMDVHLKDCKDHVNFCLNSNNTISLSLISAKTKFAAMASGTPTETNWPIKDVLIRGGFVTTINKHIAEQPRAQEVNPFKVVDVLEHDVPQPNR
ncbi:hypothetical protein [Candidatus Wolbachia massiliensis]|uniref:Uncharacterized protein n=1 Tax=Candidatus Wolbachia massiliensis TaxID=1845000 RepID=A0A7L7YLY1_9RICK|nr:hypothetical protein [Candidatus Wolbachia massiliensis]QOD38224.1 hypothetical protein ID128_05555 [Candidatus Wolbachia massiliensis]